MVRFIEVEMTISYKGKKKTIDKLVIDTGAAYTLISSDIVDEIGIYFENGDPLVSSYGIGGEEYSFRKPVDFIKLGNHEIPIHLSLPHLIYSTNQARLPR